MIHCINLTLIMMMNRGGSRLAPLCKQLESRITHLSITDWGSAI